MSGEIVHAFTLRIPELKPIIEKVEDELLFARKKFPSNKMMLHALQEECGEATQAMLNQYYLNMDMDSDPVAIQQMNKKVRKELIQIISMCVRVYQEGDADFPYNPN